MLVGAVVGITEGVYVGIRVLVGSGAESLTAVGEGTGADVAKVGPAQALVKKMKTSINRPVCFMVFSFQTHLQLFYLFTSAPLQSRLYNIQQLS
jgi:hypothetical protein